MSRWQGKTVVITGAGSGIGRSLAHAWAGRGSALVLADVHEANLAATRASIVSTRGAAADVATHVVDVADRGQMAAFARTVGRADVLVNNAGVTIVERFEATSLDAFDRVLGVDLLGVVHGCHFFLPALRRSGGHIVNVSSMIGFIGAPTQSAYCVAKSGVRALSDSLRAELAPRGVGVTCVFPGTVRTPLVRELPAPPFVRKLLERLDGVGIDPNTVAERIVRGVERGAQRVVVGADARVLYALSRVSPTAFVSIATAAMRAYVRFAEPR